MLEHPEPLGPCALADPLALLPAIVGVMRPPHLQDNVFNDACFSLWFGSLRRACHRHCPWDGAQLVSHLPREHWAATVQHIQPVEEHRPCTANRGEI